MATPLRIGIDALPLQVRSAGVARYVRALLDGLRGRAGVAIRPFGLPRPWPAPEAGGAAGSPLYPLVMGIGLPRLAPLEAALAEVDVFHATAYAMPRRRRVPVVLTVHDLTLLRAPELGTPALRRSVRRAAARAAEARLVIADSEATRRDLIELAALPAARIRVVPLGVDAAFRPVAPPPGRRPAPYLLHVGTIEPRKNLPRLIEACAPLWRGGALRQRLVLAGAPGWGSAAVEAAIARHGAGDWVVRLGRVADADLPALYAGADAVLVPSLYEGFGLPLLEALACGAPVIAAAAGALPEVAGDAALLVDPRDAGAWGAAITHLLSDPDLAARLRAAGPRRAAPFTWTRCAEQTLAVYREALDS